MFSNTVHAIILAGGASTRMGAVKQTLEIEGYSMIDHTVMQAAKLPVERIVIVTGAHADAVMDAVTVTDSRIQFVHNPVHETGQATSLKKGLCYAQSRGAHALVMLADQPCISEETYQAVYDEGLSMKASRKPYTVRPIFHGRQGHPVFFGRPYMLNLMCLKLPGDEGGKRLNNQVLSLHTPVNDPLITFDVDTPKAYEKAKELIKAASSETLKN
ncbi:nucleotidyltransferase family protein [Salisediminibacterium beveridgei]|uniref:4-Diphosphocytidyl-2C-Methyl-D-Erythritol Synthase n=1 Tax=Salisediminibacterium beveridgei TaxID=632773 RepID=A0A1D7QYF1_9BACI|nr:nucleotidyltransferase family protein [Salisediminibacterium beveridgei]AOM84030.1 4-Diphosphocytidyl-2C-Methyl-D-Erythritol Synthase [Salisediminibacterium beveridgei]